MVAIESVVYVYIDVNDAAHLAFQLRCNTASNSTCGSIQRYTYNSILISILIYTGCIKNMYTFKYPAVVSI